AGDAAEEFGGGGVAEDGDVDVGGTGGFGEEGAVDVGLDAAEASLHPVAVDEGDDVLFFEGGAGVGLGVVVVDGGFVVGGVFAGEDGGLGVDTVLEGVEAGGGFAFGGAGSGGLLRVGAVRCDLGW